MTGPLAPYTVLDLTRARAGPTCVRQLADWGAQVIQIDRPGRRRRRAPRRTAPTSRTCTATSARSRSTSSSRRAARSSSAWSRRPTWWWRTSGPTSSTGWASTTRRCAPINPRLVYGSISGFGQDGPYRDRPGFDQIAQGLGGLMSVTGLPGQGPRARRHPDRRPHGRLFLAQGILAALLERERSGQGQWVHTSLLQAHDHDARLPGRALADRRRGRRRRRATTTRPASPPASSRPRTATSTSPPPASTCSGGSARPSARPALLDDPRFRTPADRSKHRAGADASRSSACSRRRPSDEWVERLNAAGVPAGPILDIREVFEDEQVRASQHEPAGHASGPRPPARPGAAGSRCRARRRRCGVPPRTLASTPARSSASLATRTPRSTTSAARRSSRRPDGRVDTVGAGRVPRGSDP